MMRFFFLTFPITVVKRQRESIIQTCSPSSLGKGVRREEQEVVISITVVKAMLKYNPQRRESTPYSR